MLFNFLPISSMQFTAAMDYTWFCDSYVNCVPPEKQIRFKVCFTVTAMIRETNPLTLSLLHLFITAITEVYLVSVNKRVSGLFCSVSS